MTTALYQDLTEQEQREIRMFGCLKDQVHEAVDSYLLTRSPKEVVTSMMMSAWRELNWGDTEDARQTLNRVKITIQRFYSGDQRGFFFEPEGQAYSILSDVQQMIEFEDIVNAKICIDEAHNLIEQGGNIRG